MRPSASKKLTQFWRSKPDCLTLSSDFEAIKYRVIYNFEIYEQGKEIKIDGKSKAERVQAEREKEKQFPGFENWRAAVEAHARIREPNNLT